MIDLENFAHKELWKEEDPIWQPLLHLNDYLKSQVFKIEIDLPVGVFLKNPELISIGAGTFIEPGVMIYGPCIIGKNCYIRQGAYIRENVILGNDCQIGHSAELKHSILFNGAAATHFTYVGDSILGNFVNLGAGVKCANLRIDRKEVTVVYNGRRIQTSLKKFGAIVGDFVQIGCNSVLNPGTLIGKESFIHPLSNIKGTIPARSQIDANGITPIDQKILEKLLWKSTAPK